jgi:hypothetical protein
MVRNLRFAEPRGPDEKSLHDKVYLSGDRVYIHAGLIIGHAGCSAFQFFDAAKLQPSSDKLKYERAVRDLCVSEKRERGEYELHAQAKKTLRIIIGPEPSDPCYAEWWRNRLISVRLEREQGRAVLWGHTPPVPLEPEKPAEVKPKRKRAKK